MDPLSPLQISLWISTGPSDLRLWTQSPAFILCNKLVKEENMWVAPIDHRIDQSILQSLRFIILALLCMNLQPISTTQAANSCMNQQFHRNIQMFKKSSKSSLHGFTTQNSKCIEANNTVNTQLLFLLRNHTNTQFRSLL